MKEFETVEQYVAPAVKQKRIRNEPHRVSAQIGRARRVIMEFPFALSKKQFDAMQELGVLCTIQVEV